jgi:nucleotide-binding universal stress UspA family protein
MRFTTIVTALDPITPADRVLPVVSALARSGSLPVEVVTVLAPGEAEPPVQREIGRRVEHYGLQTTTLHMLHHDSPGQAIAEHVTSREGVLLVVAASAYGAWGENDVDTTTEQVLGHVGQPVLVVGPHAEPRLGSLLVAVDETGIADAAVTIVESWVRTFPGGEPRLVTVVPPSTWPDGEERLQSEILDRYLQQLTDRGITATLDVRRERDPGQALLSRAASIDDAIVVVTSPRFRDGLSHWYDTTRMLVRFATRPVLVVPKGLA